MTETNDRGTSIDIGGEIYEMILTTKATKEIAKRYGGLEALGDKLLKCENFEKALDEIVWLITLLCNQSILIHNLKNKENTRELLTEEKVELLTNPLEMAKYKDSIMNAIYKGVSRNVESDDVPLKNTQTGRRPPPE